MRSLVFNRVVRLRDLVCCSVANLRILVFKSVVSLRSLVLVEAAYHALGPHTLHTFYCLNIFSLLLLCVFKSCTSISCLHKVKNLCIQCTQAQFHIETFPSEIFSYTSFTYWVCAELYLSYFEYARNDTDLNLIKWRMASVCWTILNLHWRLDILNKEPLKINLKVCILNTYIETHVQCFNSTCLYLLPLHQ